MTEPGLVPYILARAIADGGCMRWTGYCFNGHPAGTVGGKKVLIRRALWEATNGPIPAGKILRCTCETPLCIEHLELTTYQAVAKQLGAVGVMSGPVRSAHSTGFHADRFRRVHEHAVLFYRGMWADVYHCPQFTPDATARTVRRKTRPTHTGHIEAGHYTSVDGGPRLMCSVLEVRNEHGRAIHPTQKPLALVAPLVRYSVPPGGSLVVPFAGSGSDLIVAQAEGLEALGVELDPVMADKARGRIADDAPLFAEVTAA